MSQKSMPVFTGDSHVGMHTTKTDKPMDIFLTYFHHKDGILRYFWDAKWEAGIFHYTHDMNKGQET